MIYITFTQSIYHNVFLSEKLKLFGIITFVSDELFYNIKSYLMNTFRVILAFVFFIAVAQSFNLV